MVTLPNGKNVHFVAFGYQDYILSKDDERKKRYIIRHKKNENWNKNGINTACFWIDGCYRTSSH